MMDSSLIPKDEKSSSETDDLILIEYKKIVRSAEKEAEEISKLCEEIFFEYIA